MYTVYRHSATCTVCVGHSALILESVGRGCKVQRLTRPLRVPAGRRVFEPTTNPADTRVRVPHPTGWPRLLTVCQWTDAPALIASAGTPPESAALRAADRRTSKRVGVTKTVLDLVCPGSWMEWPNNRSAGSSCMHWWARKPIGLAAHGCGKLTQHEILSTRGK